MSLRIRAEHLERMRAHGERTYPHECCGLLLGSYVDDGREKEVKELRELDNEREDSRHNRFLITPEALFQAEREARSLSLDIVGFYHSHPDAPARPSEYDREHAWPTYSYIIVSVSNGQSCDVTSWVLLDDRTRFEAEHISASLEV